MSNKIKGDCYSVAANYALDNNVLLCHGRPVYQGTQTPDADGRFGHAWCESLDGLVVIDKSNGKDFALPRDLYYAVGDIEEDDVIRFTPEEARQMLLHEMTWGPWGVKE